MLVKKILKKIKMIIISMIIHKNVYSKDISRGRFNFTKNEVFIFYILIIILTIMLTNKFYGGNQLINCFTIISGIEYHYFKKVIRDKGQ